MYVTKKAQKRHNWVSDHYFVPILVDSRVWHPKISLPNKNHHSTTIFLFWLYSTTLTPIRYSCVLITLKLRLGHSFIFTQKVYQISKFTLKVIWFLLIVVLVDTSHCWCICEPPPNYLSLTNQAIFWYISLCYLSLYPFSPDSLRLIFVLCKWQTPQRIPREFILEALYLGIMWR